MSDTPEEPRNSPPPPPLPKRVPPPMPLAAGPPPVPKKTNWMEECFQELGLAPDPKGLAGMNYIGIYRSREWKIHCSVRKRTKYTSADTSRRVYHGHRLEIEAHTSVGTRLNVVCPQSGLERWIAKTNRRFGAHLIENTGLPAIFQVWANEKPWAETFVRKAEFARLINVMMPANDLAPNIGLKWWPGRLSFSQRQAIGKIDAEKLTNWIDAVADLAELAENNPPTQQMELNRFEKFAQKNPLGAGCLIFGSLFAIVILIAFLFVGILLGISFLLSKAG